MRDANLEHYWPRRSVRRQRARVRRLTDVAQKRSRTLCNAATISVGFLVLWMKEMVGTLRWELVSLVPMSLTPGALLR